MIHTTCIAIVNAPHKGSWSYERVALMEWVLLKNGNVRWEVHEQIGASHTKGAKCLKALATAESEKRQIPYDGSVRNHAPVDLSQLSEALSDPNCSDYFTEIGAHKILRDEMRDEVMRQLTALYSAK